MSINSSIYVTLKDSTGQTHTGDSTIIPTAFVYSMLEKLEFIKDFNRLDYIDITVEGQERIFNPAHVVWLEFNVVEVNSTKLSLTVEELRDMGLYESTDDA